MGYIGPVLVERIKRHYQNSYVIGYDSGYFSHVLTNAKKMPEVLVDEQCFGDIRNFPEALLENIDVVIHLASISNDPIGNMFEDVTDKINSIASEKIAQLAKIKGCKRFIFASSCSMYGSAEGDARKEGDQLNPLTAYARSKFYMENVLDKLADDNFVITNLRFSTACGMSPRLRLDLVLNDFVASAIATGVVEILSDGTPWRPLIDVKDMVTSMIWAIERDSKMGNAISINVGKSDWNYQIKDIANKVAEVIKGVEVKVNENPMPDKRSYKVDFSLYEKLAPDYQPSVSLEQSISELQQGLTEMRFSNGEFRNSRFMRLKVLLEHIEENRLSKDLFWVLS